MTISERFRKMVRDFLRIEPASMGSVSVQQEMDFATNAFKNRLWYRGKAYELDQFFTQIQGVTGNGNQLFWSARASAGREIRKVHTGIPKIMVDTLVNIIVSDFNGFEFEDNTEIEDLWERIADENDFKKIFKKAVTEALYIGDGAFKISFDSDLSELPILEWFGGDKVEFVRDRGRMKEVVFYVDYNKKGKKYTLEERYGHGSITYRLMCGDKEVPLDTLDETRNLAPVTFDKHVMLAVPFFISESEEWEGRGQSLFEGKGDNFDALDEAFSQWMQAMRQARPKEYIPECLIPRDPNGGAFLLPNPFDNQFIRVADDNSENGKNEVKLNQPTFPTNDYLQTYMTSLDLCLQGRISPSTLGIDVKKLDNAEAQREKEKTTLYSRANIIEALESVLPALAEAVLASYFIAKRQTKDLPEITISFGEYANPSFEALVETLSNPNTPMSIEAKVEEMWGDSRDDEWKAAEVARIKEENGVAMMDEPTFAGSDLGLM